MSKTTNEKCFYEKMSTVLRKPFSKEIDLEKLEEEFAKSVEKKVKEITDVLKASHSKFEDPDFGPKDDDEHGALALYGPKGPPPPAGHSKYPPPETIRWDRPQYCDTKFLHDHDEESEETAEDDEEEDEEFGGDKKDDEVWCMNGALFLDGSSAGDVVQGKLGDCWFLAALSVLGTRPKLLEKCFWRTDTFKEYGLYVCRFYKDCSLMYVIIDDRIPVFDTQGKTNGKVVFGQCRDPNELWVPLLEKAYAKLYGCYKSLIGGYSHYALADLTGYAPRLVGLKPGYMGYSDALTDSEVWDTLVRYRDWNCLMGCSIQSNPGSGQKVEADAGQGLNMGHAYSLLDVREVLLPDKGEKKKLVRLRNPWGHGEWTGPWSDDSKEFQTYKDTLTEIFDRKEINDGQVTASNDGTFFMSFDDWWHRFTSLFVAIQFPKEDGWEGRFCTGNWSGETGGNRQTLTWLNNPKIKFTIQENIKNDKKKTRKVFVGLYINDPRLALGNEYFKDPLFDVGVGFDIVKQSEFELTYEKRLALSASAITSNTSNNRALIISGSHTFTSEYPTQQPPYMFGTTQVESEIEVGEYYIVPSLFKRKQSGTYYLTVYVDGPFELEGE